ncbi:MAG: cation diffusion facilitator family transporter [Oscillospiraceae bacterium]|jgi:cation diffusion facilitator family transporter|nr:cation diffusion facilitator family transporter [Oscillospiraceae bacterium]
MEKQNEKLAMKVSRNTLIGNTALVAVKAFAGVYAHSAAMLADSIHSLSDILSTVIVMVGVKLAGKEADQKHPYGHERFECVAAIILSGILLFTGVGIGFTGVKSIISMEYGKFTIPGFIALIAAIISIVSKESMYWYTRIAAKKVNSDALMADAWHHRSDALSSIGSFAGILGARLGFPVLDPLAAIIICLIIIKVSVDIFRDAIGKMTDKSCDGAVVDEMKKVVLAQEYVLGIDEIRTRIFGDKIYVDLDILADGCSTLKEAHDVADQVHDAIEGKFSQVKHCMVHVSPYNTESQKDDEP